MKKKIIVKIQYIHDDTCRYFGTHDELDCDCGARIIENEEYSIEEANKS